MDIPYRNRLEVQRFSRSRVRAMLQFLSFQHLQLDLRKWKMEKKFTERLAMSEVAVPITLFGCYRDRRTKNSQLQLTEIIRGGTQRTLCDR